LTLDYALTELRAGSGIQFCPRCVAALERVVARGGLRSTFAEITVRASDAATPTHVV
jgi:HD-GYP domain-containing protein (c-di-GMP phosphodiesterase class II)